jgi:glycosyltransferase involved in cell wall biosynthesis
MKILFVDQFSEPGGAQLALLDAIDGVIGRGWAPVVMAPGSGPLLTQSSRRGIPVVKLPLSPMANGRKSPRDMLTFVSELPRLKIALQRAVALHGAGLVYVNGPRVLPAATDLDVPVLFHAHSYVSGVAPRWLAARAIKRAGATVIAASQFVARQFENAESAAVRVIYNGAPNLSSEPRSFDARAGKLHIGMVGRIAREKGQLDFVRAARLMGGDAASFTIYGDALFSQPEYTRRVRAEAADAPFAFQGWRENAASIYRELDILAVPSFDREASTRVIMEAFSAGVPVVAYASGGIPEIVKHGLTGILTERRGFESLAGSLGQLLADRSKMLALSLAGRAEWAKRFTREGFQDSICEVIASLPSSSHHRAGHTRTMQPGRDSKGWRGSACLAGNTQPDAPGRPATASSRAAAGRPAGEAARAPVPD